MGEEQGKPKPPPQNPSDKIFDNIFEFKFMAKSMDKEGQRSKNQYNKLIQKVKDCIKKGDYEQAKISAQEAISSKNMATRYQMLSTKVGTIATKLQSAYQTQRLSEGMAGLVQKMADAGKAMDLVAMNEAMRGVIS